MDLKIFFFPWVYSFSFKGCHFPIKWSWYLYKKKHSILTNVLVMSFPSIFYSISVYRIEQFICLSSIILISNMIAFHQILNALSLSYSLLIFCFLGLVWSLGTLDFIHNSIMIFHLWKRWPWDLGEIDMK